ncbi:MAG: nucleotidyl transferase AbiEii/AbiGii toxin family protein [Betaproteobacteria bacterium]|jgi:hypothetical protein
MVIARGLREGAWKDLLAHALSIIEDIKGHATADPFCTFGGATVLMLRYQHRLSKDIDRKKFIFIDQINELHFHQESWPCETVECLSPQ